MASKYLTPSNDSDKEDIIATLAYIQSLNGEIKSLTDKKKEAVSWLVKKLGYDQTKEGTVHYGDEDNFVTFEVSRTYKVDTNKLADLVQENQISGETADRVFRWKAEVNVTEWKSLDEDAKTILAQAVTTKTDSPSIKINLAKE